MSDSQIILHHYPQSPVSEKVRVVLGIKGLDWKSVEIPRLPPKPNLMPLTGGYRLTPVMQIGADIFCDSLAIIREIDRRHPTPTLFPGGAEGMAWGVARWTDGPMCKDVTTIAMVEMSDTMPTEFLADRGPLYFGADFTLDGLKAKYTESLVNVRAQLGWLNERVAIRQFMLGSEPGLPDALCYYLVWFLRDRMAEAEPFLSQFKNIIAWEQRMKDIGHGTPDDISDLDALAIAKNSTHQTPERADPGDPQGLNVGDKITIEPADGGVPVEGILRNLSASTIAILREDDQVGQVCVHLPRLGYRATRVS
ncbi:MAG: glutathione S-transferase family protein [Rhodospirillales bacterium]|nr:glutathione S-transferase family protein [Rhodospirillaceae bacterium]MBT7486871.1 glutathione S-transferase family protein [Rhodospirillales bacterium]MBT5034248.1 glutathione S-transferase family protein [Rhodospirillaceae bacterium]MBT6218179.1 glutathione S-transferase family protein [Rhodospirillaceae bacterium]MBT6363308.1 glutathione S-transferase family protein [Rhodospirillaceae bacterium]